MRYLILLLFLVLSFSLYSTDDDHHDHDEDKVSHEQHEDHENHDDHAEHEIEDHHDDHEVSKAIGLGKAIEEVSEIEGFRLSKDSFKLLEIGLMEVSRIPLRIDRDALVATRKEKGVYRFRNGFFKFLIAKKIVTDGQEVLITVDDIKIGDQIAITKLDLIKVCDIYSTDTAEYGHSH